MNLFEAFGKLNEEEFAVNVDGISSLGDFLDDNAVVDPVLDIIDPQMEDGEAPEESHIGQIILCCEVCKSLVYKQPEEIIKDTESDLVNVDEECPLCNSMNGFEVIGKIAPITEESEIDASLTDPTMYTGEPLDEAIPRDMANALKNANIDNIKYHRTYGPDYQNREYTEISVQDAMAMRRAGTANKVEMIVNGEPVRFRTDGSVLYNSSGVRNNFGTLAKEASKIYKFSGDDSIAVKKRQERRDTTNTLPVYKKYSNNSEYIDPGSGEHIKPSKWDENELNRLIQYKVEYEKKLSDLEMMWEDGDISRNQYDSKKDDLQKGISRLEKDIQRIQDNLPRNTAYEKRYDAQAQLMGSGRTRFVDIKRNPAEKTLERSKKELEKADEERLIKINEIRSKILSLEKDIEKLESRSDFTTKYKQQQLADAEKKLEQQQKDLELIKQGKYVPESLKQEAFDFTAKEGTIANLLAASMDKLSVTDDPTAVKNEIVEIIKSSDEISPKVKADALRKIMAPKSTTALLSTLATFMTGIKTIKDPRKQKQLITASALDEDMQHVEIETDTDVTTVDQAEDGGVQVSTQPKEDSIEEVIQPLTDEEEAQIDSQTVEETTEEDEAELFDDFDEEGFDDLGESYLKEVYENVTSFKTTDVRRENGKLVVEGMINFNSGNKKATSFIFETVTNNKGKVRLLGENKNITPAKRSFRVNGSLNENKFICESLRYRYNEGDNRIFGVCKRK